MRYKCFKKVKKDCNKGGDYWRDFDFNEHLKLTAYQTSYQYFLEHYPPPLKVLEAGCGLGRWVVPLAQNNYQVTGIEIEKEALDVIKKNFVSQNLSLVHGDIFKMPFEDKSFDIVISLGVLEHFEKRRTLDEAVQEHLRVLKDNGIFFITIPFTSLIRILIHLPYKIFVSLVRKLKGNKEFFSEFRYSRKSFVKVLERNNIVLKMTLFDDLTDPFNFGLTVDNPFKQFFRDEDIPYRLNKRGRWYFRLLWKIHPGLISGAICYVCTKKISS